jgi:hypothetical protein
VLVDGNSFILGAVYSEVKIRLGHASLGSVPFVHLQAWS